MPQLEKPVDVVDRGPASTRGGAAVLGALVADGRLPTVLAGAESWHAHIDRLRLTRSGSVEVTWLGGPAVDDVAHLLIATVTGLSQRVAAEERMLLSYGGRVPVELSRGWRH